MLSIRAYRAKRGVYILLSMFCALSVGAPLHGALDQAASQGGPENTGRSSHIVRYSGREYQTTSPAEASRPYSYASLKSLTDDEIVEYMGRGKSMLNLEHDALPKTVLPKGFWKMPPKTAALAFAEANRGTEHRMEYKLGFNEPAGDQPPASGHITFADIAAHANVRTHYFLRFDPKDSYLDYGREFDRWSFFREIDYDFRHVPLSYEEAVHMAHVIWWLGRLKTISQPGSFSDQYGSMGGGTSADGTGRMTLVGDNRPASMEAKGTVWAMSSIPLAWRGGKVDDNLLLNATSFLLAQSFQEYLGTRWSSLEPKRDRSASARDRTARTYPKPGDPVSLNARRFISLWTPGQKRISSPIMLQAIHAAGDFLWSDLETSLTEIGRVLPDAGKKPRSREEIYRDMDRISREIKDPKDRISRMDALVEELKQGRWDTDTSLPDLHKAINSSLQKLRLADRPAELAKLACSEEQDAMWALGRLREVDQRRYVNTLEWLLKNSKDESKRRVFDQIAKADRAKAEELARKVPAGRASDLSIGAYSVLDKAKAIPDEAQRVKSLIQLASDQKNERIDRSHAVDQLVPNGNPLRYPQKDIDDLLGKILVERTQGATGIDLSQFLRERAALALALRGRAAEYDRILEGSKTEQPPSGEAMIEAAALLTTFNPDQLKPRMAAFIKPHLSVTRWNVGELLWSVWIADLQELKSELMRIATSGPDDYEDRKASGAGPESRLEGRVHMARQILATWLEEDAVTRGKLLIALGMQDGWILSQDQPARWTRMKLSLQQLRRDLSPQDLIKVQDFVKARQARWGGDKIASPETGTNPYDDFAAMALGILK